MPIEDKISKKSIDELIGDSIDRQEIIDKINGKVKELRKNFNKKVKKWREECQDDIDIAIARVTARIKDRWEKKIEKARNKFNENTIKPLKERKEYYQYEERITNDAFKEKAGIQEEIISKKVTVVSKVNNMETINDGLRLAKTNIMNGDAWKIGYNVTINLLKEEFDTLECKEEVQDVIERVENVKGSSKVARKILGGLLEELIDLLFV